MRKYSAAREERFQLVVKMRDEGKSFNQIGEFLKLTSGRARQIHSHAIRRIAWLKRPKPFEFVRFPVLFRTVNPSRFL